MAHNTKKCAVYFFHCVSEEICAGMIRFWQRNRRSTEDFITGDSTSSNNKYYFQDCFIF